MDDDLLSDVLKEVHLSGAVFFDVKGHAPWVAEAPSSSDLSGLVLPGAQHVISYHVIAQGSCWVRLLEGTAASEELHEGSVVIFPHGLPHILSSDPDLRAPFDPAILDQPRPEYIEPLLLTQDGDGPETVRLICGFLGCDILPFNPLLSALPDILVITDGYTARDGWLATLIRAAAAEGRDDRSGGRNVLTRLSELIFVEALRVHLETLPSEARGWLAALRVPHIRRALSLIHEDVTRNWTIGSLAREVGVSRTILATSFNSTIGLPPIAYLTKWRMQVAAGMLAESEKPISDISETVGYQSEASFSRAFRRVADSPPGTWREKAKRRVGESTNG